MSVFGDSGSDGCGGGWFRILEAPVSRHLASSLGEGGGAILFILLYNVVHFLCQKMPAETKIIKTKMPAETLKQKSIDVIVVALDYSLMHTRAYMLKA